ncbi:Os04g0654800 [Oryza sativa Japonica Group]|uniref:Receptor-like serine/threonine-protein kinase n=2 Tax=Oryza sativa subsp. japonica TaxID=39947 RepID=A0A0P0WFW5_ORYSJ|nr:Os04g0654800 [Oryza sativa Japonica Group]
MTVHTISIGKCHCQQASHILSPFKPVFKLEVGTHASSPVGLGYTMNRVHGLHLIVLTSLCCVALSAGEGDRRSVLWRGGSIAVEDAADSVLVSPSGNFSCGFYKVATNAYTLAVWFTASADATVAWTANRDTPVNGVGSRAELRKDGSLVLQDYDGRVVWSTNTSGTPADRAQLLDTGNLVVSDAAGNRLWQSFDWPTDTLLPEQPVTRYRQLVSAEARGSPYSGYYKFYFDSSNILNLMYDGPEISSNYWPDPFKKWWDNNRTAFNSSRHGSFDRRGVFTASDQLQFNASDMGDGGVMRRLTLDYDGNLRLYSLDAAAGRWHVTWVAVQRQCDVHGLCGRYGICTYSQGPTCSCPDGYVPHDASDWSKGCRRTFDVRCGEDVAFAEMRHTDYWGFDLNYTAGISFDTCRRLCLVDCRCEAFGYRQGTGECYPKISLWNGRVMSIPYQTIYLKFPTGAKNLNPSLLHFDGHTCTMDERDATVSSSYLHGRRNTINFIYFYSFLAVVFVVEAIFVVVGYLFVFRADSVAAGRVGDEGYSLVFSHFRRFTYDELSDATCGFRDEIAKGGTGSVYKGVLEDGRSIAVKRLDEMTQADEVFRSELSVIGRINHMNLVRIWGFCSEHPHRLLVSEFVENGSLDKALFCDDGESSGVVVLPWRSRYKIAVGVAKALAYLHHECLEWIVHCDVKPENILLDGDFEPKVTDFGLVKLLSRDAGSHMALSRVQGTRGYITPECWTVGRSINGKADVYSFGVVLLELVRGQRVCDWVAAAATADGAWNVQRLAVWLKEKLKCDDGELPAWLEELVDARLRGDFNHVQAAGLLELAVSCVDGEPSRRPSMSTVVHKLISLDTIEHHLYATHELAANAAVVSLVGDVGGINCVCRVEDLNCFSC